MKREKREMDACEDAAMGKGKMMMMEEQDAGMDELLAALGYKVRSSDMADVAEKLEQLDMVMMGGSGSVAPDDGLLSHLATDTVHYNPSDLYSWLDSMLSEVNAPLPAAVQDAQPSPPQIYNHSFESGASMSSTITTVEPLSGGGSQPSVEVGMSRDRKRMRSSSSRGIGTVGVESVPSAASTTEVSSMPIVVADSQDAGIRLVQALMACAEAVQQENFTAADALVKQISVLATSQAGAMRKVAGYFAEALARRIYRLNPQQDCSLDSAFSDILQMHFYESCPYLKFAHFTANQAILEAFAGHRRVHVIDFGMMQGMQWPALMQALALRPGGPPSFRLTGIGPPQPDNTDALQQVGWKLAQLADTIGIEFEYRGLVAGSLADLEPYMLELAPPAKEETETEPAAVAVNSVLELHRLLNRQGAIEKVLATVRAVWPKIVTVVEQEANHNADRFMDRFTEALHYYSTMFDSLEGGGGGEQQDQMMSEVYLGRQICNVLACEAADRTERHETLVQWRSRMERAGFDPVHLGSNAYKQASTLLAFFARGNGYGVEENEGCLTLGWHTRPLIATSAWRCSATAGGAAMG